MEESKSPFHLNESNESFELINDYYNHYNCIKCHKFPFIKICKNKKNVRITCSCFNNKKVSIKELFEIINTNEKGVNNLSETNSNINIENHLICNEHNKTFKGFSKFFLNNYCEDCFNYKKGIYNNDIIKFDGIRIEEIKIDKIIEKINDNKDIFEEIKFKNLIDAIINDYKNYPNFSHFFNIKNLLYFFNIEDKSTEKDENIINDDFIEENEPIIIEYINNISNKTKLFSKIFVKNNKKKCKIEIEGKKLDLIEKYEFKTKERKVRVKLFINKNVLEIDVYKMFSSCTNLIYVNGISKLKKIVNINKIFYNCISLSSIPDFKDWKINKDNIYLMFYNCISLIFFPYERESNINKYDEGFLGILITKYLKYNKEIIIRNINQDNEGYINLFKNRIKIEDKNKEIIILDGKDDENELL